MEQARLRAMSPTPAPDGVNVLLQAAVVFGLVAAGAFCALTHTFRHPRYVAGCSDCLLWRVEP